MQHRDEEKAAAKASRSPEVRQQTEFAEAGQCHQRLVLSHWALHFVSLGVTLCSNVHERVRRRSVGDESSHAIPRHDVKPMNGIRTSLQALHSVYQPADQTRQVIAFQKC